MKPRGTDPTVILSLVLSIACATAVADEVYTKNKRGNDNYKKEKYEEALNEYADALLIAPSDSLLKMNRGSTLYRLGRLQEADSAYAGTLSMADRRKRADAHYNLGNIQFSEGDLLMQGGGQGADEKYKAALQCYIAALDLRPDDKDAKWNIELTQRRIKQQEQQQKNQDKQDNNKDKKDRNQDQNKQNQDKQDREKQDKDQDRNKKDEGRNNEKNQSQKNNQQQQEPPKPQPQENKDDMKKKEAERIIMQFADDADSLNKPPKKKGLGVMQRKPEKDW
jgi:Ca-activated chloride channel family protein